MSNDKILLRSYALSWIPIITAVVVIGSIVGLALWLVLP
jgi:hypothetical protein